MNWSSKFALSSVASIAGLIVTLCGNAQILNPGFEASPDFSNWTVAGAGSIQTSAYGSGPTEGNQDALFTNDNTSGAIAVGLLESNLGMAPGTLTGLGSGTVVNGSGVISDTFVAGAGQVITFDWDFLTNELDPTLNTSHNDFAFFSIGGITTILSDVTSGIFLTPPQSSASLDYLDETGFLHAPVISYTIPTTGNYNLVFGVVNVGVGDTASGLLVDNILISGVAPPPPPPPAGTPEPGTFALLFGAGTVGYTCLRRRRR